MSINENKRTRAILKRLLFDEFALNGFTLLELIIVIMILAILTLVALPNYIKQVSKARMMDGKSALGALNRAQQVYYFENNEFADSIGKLEVRAGTWNGTAYETSYYTYDVTNVEPTRVDHIAEPKPAYDQDVRTLVSANFKEGYTFTFRICQAHQAFQEPTIVDVNTCQNGRFADDY